MVKMIKYLLYITIIINITICYGKNPKNIIGGTTSTIEEHPHQVSIHWMDHILCSGSIVSDYHILTSASCILFDIGHVASNLKIIAGTNDKWNMNLLGQVKYVKYVIHHKKYDPRQQWKNDLAILRLETPVIMNQHTFEINIWKKTIPLKEILNCAGWGDSGNEITRFLQNIQLIIKKKNLCEQLFGSELSLTQTCAEPLYQHQAISQGDGGNPIVLKKHQVQLVGIVSVYFGDGSSRLIIFTRMYIYDDWISDMIYKY